MTVKTVYRIDSPGRLRVVRTPEGFLVTTGKLAKPGVMIYEQADGTQIRELVEPETLQDPVSNATLVGKAFTLEHPADDVTPDNWTDLSHGVWGPPEYDEAHEDGPGLYAPVTVHTRKMLDILDDDNGPKELSPGYSVKVDDTPGEHPEYGPYDARQIPGTRRYNHGALTEAARGGPDLTIRKDSAFEVTTMTTPAKKKTDTAPDPSETKTDAEKMDAFMKEMRDGMKSLSDRMSALEEKKSDATAEDPEADPEKKSDPDPPEDPEKKKKGDSAADRLAWFNARRDLVDLANAHGVENPDGMGDADLKVAIVQKVRPTNTRKDSAYIDAALDMIREGAVQTASDRYADFGADLVDPNKRKDTADNPAPFDPDAEFFRRARGLSNQ